jgi:zinc transport system substrate-binding protein
MITYRKVRLLMAAAVVLFVAGCERTEKRSDLSPAANDAIESSKDAPVAVSSSYLEAAVKEVLSGDVPMVRLAGPSMCPGHFDMRPSQISELARCGMLVRFDFQKSLDEKLRTNSCRVAAISVPGGMCVPNSFVSSCRQVADHLVKADRVGQSEADARLARLVERMALLQQEVERRVKAARLNDAPVLASGHQADFCRWLGLKVVAEISSSDASSIRDLDEALKTGQSAGARIVVANEPEGRRSADAVAERLGARVVVFANFPEPEEKAAFDRLVRRNLAALLDADNPGEKKP